MLTVLTQERDFKIFWGAHTLSSLGSKMYQAALLWHIYAVSESVLALGLIGIARLVPILILILLGGYIADRGKRRASLLGAQMALALISISLGVISLSAVSAELMMTCLYVSTVLTESASTFDGPARKSLIPLLVHPKRLAAALSLTGISKNGSKLIGPALMGIMVVYMEIGWVYIVNGLSYVAVIIAILMIPADHIDPFSPLDDTENDSLESPERLRTNPPLLSPRERWVSSSRNFISSTKEGFTFLWGSPLLLSLLSLDFVANLWAAATVLLPVYATEILGLGSSGYGILASSIAAGGLIASAALLYLPDPIFKGRGVVLGGVFFGVGTIVLGISEEFWVSIFALSLIGASDQISSVLRNTLHQLSLPDEMRGRLTAINMIFTKSGPRLGEIEAGLVAAWLGLAPSIIIGGVACIVSVGVIVYHHRYLWWHEA